jgi:hypothetical protein
VKIVSQQTTTSHHVPPHHAAPPGKTRRSTGRLSRLILWEWGIVLALLSGLGITVLAISHGPDPKEEAEALVARMKASAAAGRLSVMADKVAPKVCVTASWELYRTGTISVNGMTPQRVSAAILVDLCNQAETATIIWIPKPAE